MLWYAIMSAEYGLSVNLLLRSLCQRSREEVARLLGVS